MLDVFRELRDPDVRGFVIWLPVRKEDSLPAAQKHKSSDRRVSEFWNADLSVDKAFMQTLHLKRTAFDVYLVYGPHATWSASLPAKPKFWMHQRSERAGADPALHLNPGRLLEAIQQVTSKAKPSENSK